MRLGKQIERWGLGKDWSDSAREAAAESRGGGESHSDKMKALHTEFKQHAKESDSEDSFTSHGDERVGHILQDAKEHVHPEDRGKLDAMISAHEEGALMPGHHNAFGQLRAKTD